MNSSRFLFTQKTLLGNCFLALITVQFSVKSDVLFLVRAAIVVAIVQLLILLGVHIQSSDFIQLFTVIWYRLFLVFIWNVDGGEVCRQVKVSTLSSVMALTQIKSRVCNCVSNHLKLVGLSLGTMRILVYSKTC